MLVPKASISVPPVGFCPESSKCYLDVPFPLYTTLYESAASTYIAHCSTKLIRGGIPSYLKRPDRSSFKVAHPVTFYYEGAKYNLSKSGGSEIEISTIHEAHGVQELFYVSE